MDPIRLRLAPFYQHKAGGTLRKNIGLAEDGTVMLAYPEGIAQVSRIPIDWLRVLFNPRWPWPRPY